MDRVGGAKLGSCLGWSWSAGGVSTGRAKADCCRVVVVVCMVPPGLAVWARGEVVLAWVGEESRCFLKGREVATSECVEVGPLLRGE